MPAGGATNTPGNRTCVLDGLNRAQLRAFAREHRDEPPFVAEILTYSQPVRRAVLIMLVCLAEQKPRQALSDGRAGLEVCPAYFKEVATSTAYKAWTHILHWIGLEAMYPANIADLGFVLRTLHDGERWGSHYAVDDIQDARMRQTLERVRALGVRTPDEPTYGSGPGRRSALGPSERHPVVVQGPRVWMRCPAPDHEDVHPSAQVNAGGGIVYCYGCARTLGEAVVLPGQTECDFRPYLGSPAPDPDAPPTPTPIGTSYCCSVVSGMKRGYEGAPSSMRRRILVEKDRSTGVRFVRRVLTSTRLSRTIEDSRTGERARMAKTVEENAYTPIREHAPKRFGYASGEIRATVRGGSYMERKMTGYQDLLEALRAADRRVGGPKTLAKIGEACERYWDTQETDVAVDYRAFAPDLMFSLDIVKSLAVRWMCLKHTRDGKLFQVGVPIELYPVAAEWVLVDLDGFESVPVEHERTLCEAAEEVQAWLDAHPMFTGRMAVVRTSHHGVHVVAQLVDQYDPRTFYGSIYAQAVLRDLDSVALGALEGRGWEGGHADPAVHAPGRHVRRPGPRIDKSGEPYVSRLAWSTP